MTVTILSNEDSRSRWRSALMDNYGTPQLALVRGDGAHVWDADGKRYLDLYTGIAVNALGHAHPAVVQAVTEQVNTLGHTSNMFVNQPALELAEELVGLVGQPAKVVFTNSGAEAVEAAFKLSRLTGRTKIVAFDGAFHGRTMGALSVTGQPAKRTPFVPLTPEVVHIPFGDTAALESVVDGETAAVFIEPILGEGGVIPAPDGFLQAAREITSRHGALLVLDEVQTGLGRCGSWFLYQQSGIVPDVITLAKGLGGGLPLGACIGVGAAAELFKPGHHGTTFGGNPICCAAGLATVRTIAAEGLHEHAAVLGKDIAARVEQLHHPLVAGVRGVGLLMAIALNKPVSGAVAKAAQAGGYLINSVQPDSIRLAPPLVLAEADAHDFVAALPEFLDSSES
ncbi:acetylornithine transaminase [Kutzneria chonburiensis]|uniref:Acetylornithine aminotransferase n=1 Tax=Kutzneria chonburiensis TaxID=1483604 RepID=A0ABV6N7K1_9PSEU|nr:acetylornithine transaminase [Kutzneria chonburiensis]